MLTLLASAIVGLGVVGPKQVSVGDLFELRADKPSPSFAWTVVPQKTFFVADGGARIAFASGTAGTYTFVLAARNGEVVEICQHVVIVGSGPVPIPPQPTPGPLPTPTPVPPIPVPPAPEPPPATPFGLSRFIYDEAMKLTPEAKARCVAIADAFDSLASQISAGTLGGLQIGKKTREELGKAYGDQAAAWRPVDAAVQQQFRKLANEKKIVNTSDLADGYRELAVGLRAVK